MYDGVVCKATTGCVSAGEYGLTSLGTETLLTYEMTFTLSFDSGCSGEAGDSGDF